MYGQSNTAVASGSIGKCAVWNYPYTLYNNAGASQTVNDGVTVTVDQDRSIGAINLSGSGAMDLSASNGITLSGSGGEINCRWELGNYGSHTIVNNNGTFTTNSKGQPTISFATASFFTAPYAGVYRWTIGAGWGASMSGAKLNGGIGIQKQGYDYFGNIFYQNQSGSCAVTGTIQGPTWSSPLTPITLTAGQNLNYAANTAFTSGSSCNDTTLNFTIGTATLFYEN